MFQSFIADAHRYVKGAESKKTSHAAAVSILLSPGLLIIDHIHFQYNGFLYGILILSLVLARDRSTLLLSGILFAALLCLKHIYLYLAPAYFVFLLRAYCLSPQSIFRIQFANCVKLGVGIGAIFASAIGPFIYWGQLQQLLTRLFPFSRGLCHAYWAPNIWALYSFTDRVLIYCMFHYALEGLRSNLAQWPRIFIYKLIKAPSTASQEALWGTPPLPSCQMFLLGLLSY